MHPAPSLLEAPPKNDDSRPGPNHIASPDAHSSRHSESASPPIRKDTLSSTSTAVTSTTVTSAASLDTAATIYSAESSPTYSSQAIFSAKDGADVTNSEASNGRRTTRRRTGPLTSSQREKAALIRKLGACPDCRRRRVACHPSHHNMTWEDAVRKYRAQSPTMQELAPLGRRPISPAPPSAKAMYNHDNTSEMDIDSPTGQQPGRHPLSNTRQQVRKPLPTKPLTEWAERGERLTTAEGETLKAELERLVSKALANPHRSRYSAAQVLLLQWENDQDVTPAVRELTSVLEEHYHYTFTHTGPIPLTSDECKSPWRWLSRKVSDFIETRDERDTLKIIYYTGHTYLDGNREMLLASSRDQESACTIRWSGIQHILEDARSDVLVLLDAAYYPGMTRMVRREGVLEIVAASASDDHVKLIGRTAFTRVLTEELRMRAFRKPISAADLHAGVLSGYPKLIQDEHPEQEMVTSYPSPLHLMTAGNPRLPSVLLAPLPQRIQQPWGVPGSNARPGPQLTVSFKLGDEPVDPDTWAEWFRAMPEEVKDFKVDGVWRIMFR